MTAIMRIIGKANFLALGLSTSKSMAAFPDRARLAQLEVPRKRKIVDGERVRVESYRSKLNEAEIENLLNIFENCKPLNNHMLIKEQIRKYWVDLMQNFPKERVILLADWKNIFDLGKGPKLGSKFNSFDIFSFNFVFKLTFSGQ